MSVSLATFNVKDLFEPAVPGKIENLARIFATLSADVLALQEIASASLLDQVCAAMPGGDPYPHKVIGTADRRGIACALLSRFPLIRSGVHTRSSLPFPVLTAGDPEPYGTRIPLRRGFVFARVASPLGPIEVLVAHLKSARPVFLTTAEGEPALATTDAERADGLLRTLVWRGAEARFLRACIDDLFAKEPHALVAAMGDFNDLPQSVPLRIIAGFGATALVDPSTRVHADHRFSVLHRGTPEQIDHILLSGNLAAKVQDCCFLNRELRDHSSLLGEFVPTPDSDHAPFTVRLE